LRDVGHLLVLGLIGVLVYGGLVVVLFGARWRNRAGSPGIPSP
jgi:hypothetical protein